jgi:hypothetical protein
MDTHEFDSHTRGGIVIAKNEYGNGRSIACAVASGVTSDVLLMGGRATCGYWGYNTAAAAAPNPARRRRSIGGS